MNRLGAAGEAFLFIINFMMDEVYVIPETEIPDCPLKFQIPGRPGMKREADRLPDFNFSAAPVTYPQYLKAFNKVQAELQQGNSYLTNLTLPTPVSTGLTLEQIYTHSDAPYKLLFDDRFVVFSPEPFVQINKGVISSFPMKGTIDANLENAESVILLDPKETAEHRTIVDLIRNDLGMVAKNVQVKRFRYIDTIQTHKGTLLQVSSEITADLPPDYPARIGEVLFTLLPAGSVTGAPKKKTVEVILEAEQYDRGFYTGVFGFFDGVNLDSSVMIRFIEQVPDGSKLFKSGGGITAFSDPEKEYHELIDKIYVPFTGIH